MLIKIQSILLVVVAMLLLSGCVLEPYNAPVNGSTAQIRLMSNYQNFAFYNTKTCPPFKSKYVMFDPIMSRFNTPESLNMLSPPSTKIPYTEKVIPANSSFIISGAIETPTKVCSVNAIFTPTANSQYEAHIKIEQNYCKMELFEIENNKEVTRKPVELLPCTR